MRFIGDIFSFVTIFLLLGCSETQSSNKDELKSNQETVNGISKPTKDSLLKIINNKAFKVQKNFDFGYIQLSSINNVKFSDEIRFQYDPTENTTYYKYLKAERNETFLSLTFDILSKKTPKEKNIETLKYRDEYLPQIYLIKIDTTLPNNPFINLGRLDYEMVNKLPSHISWYEEYFNYKEKGKFLFYTKITEQLKSEKLLLTIQSPEGFNLEPLKITQSIAWLKNR